MKPEIIVDGHWLSALMPWGDLEWVTSWPGGTESITFDVARNHRLFRPDARVEIDRGGVRLALGSLLDTPRGAPLQAEGLHRKAEDEPALSSLGNATLAVGEAVDAAITRGLPWSRPNPDYAYASTGAINPPGSTDVALDPDRLHSLAEELDATAAANGCHWGVGTDGVLQVLPWEPASLHMLPGMTGLAISRDGYASTLHARYLDLTTMTYQTVTATDTAAESRWGRVPRTLTEPLAQGAAITEADAQQILDGLIAQGRSAIGWATSLEVQKGDVVTENGQPVDLCRIHARKTLRLHGLVQDFADLAGRMWVDVPIARTRHKVGSVTIEPRGLSSPMNDALAGAA